MGGGAKPPTLIEGPQSMKLKVQQVMDATLVISQIIREDRAMPQKGRYRLARLHSKLLPEFTTINAQRDELIKAYDTHVMVSETDPETGAVIEVATAEFTVPEDKMPEFTEAWKAIAGEEIDIDVEPIPLSQLDIGGDIDGNISVNEFIVLGSLIADT